MKRAILSVTRGGLATARKISQELGGELFTLEKYAIDQDTLPIRGSLRDFMQNIFRDYQEIVMIMSCGIAVRSIAPYLNSKLTDPAVVVLDEKGNFVISLLSGHIGGANDLAEKIARVTGGQAVITTASDNLGLESVDMLAKRYHLYMEDMEQVKKVTSALVNGQKVMLVNDSPLNIEVNSLDHVALHQLHREEADALIYVGNKVELGLEHDPFPIAKLRPANLVLGIGCKKNTDSEKLDNAVRKFFEDHNISLYCLKAIATVDVKYGEPAILNLTDKLSLPICIVNREAILPIEDKFAYSDFVKKTIGVGCVCEPSAYIVSKRGRMVAPKTAFNGITLCIYEEEKGLDRDAVGSVPYGVPVE